MYECSQVKYVCKYAHKLRIYDYKLRMYTLAFGHVIWELYLYMFFFYNKFFGWVSRVCDPLSYEIRRAAVELDVYICIMFSLVVHSGCVIRWVMNSGVWPLSLMYIYVLFFLWLCASGVWPVELWIPTCGRWTWCIYICITFYSI